MRCSDGVLNPNLIWLTWIADIDTDSVKWFRKIKHGSY